MTPELVNEGERSDTPGGAEGRRRRSSPWKADGRGVVRASASDSGSLS